MSIRTLFTKIRRRRDHFVDVGFLSPPVSDRPTIVLYRMSMLVSYHPQCPTDLDLLGVWRSTLFSKCHFFNAPALGNSL